MGKYKKELLFTLAVLAAAAGLWLATHAGRGTGNVAVVRYGDHRWSSASTYPKTPITTSIPAPTPSTCMWKTAASPL